MTQEYNPGDHVEFVHAGCEHNGEVIRVNQKTVTVKLENCRTLRIPLDRVRHALPDNVIRMPQHMCGVGRRVQFRGPDGMTITGMITEITRETAKILPDAGPADSWRVQHEHIVPHDGELPARAEHLVMQDIARCYARLTYGTPNKTPFRHRLQELFIELGRRVDQKTALDWALRREGGR